VAVGVDHARSVPREPQGAGRGSEKASGRCRAPIGSHAFQNTLV
jgi:hypothetical protein